MSNVKIVCYCCDSSAIAIKNGPSANDPDVELRQRTCTGTLDLVEVLKDIRAGVDVVLVLACLEGNCEHGYGNIRARRRVERARSILKAIGLDEGRVEMAYIAPNQAWRYAEVLSEMKKRATGPEHDRTEGDKDDNS